MKKQLLLLAGLFLLFIVSCKKDKGDDLPLTFEERVELARSNLKTEKERNFFDASYLLGANPHILPTLRPRSVTDSLVGELKDFMLLKNDERPFVLSWIEQLGYPVWGESYLTPELGNGSNMVVVTPLAKIDDNHISGFMLAFPDHWTTPQFYVEVTEREFIDAQTMAGWPD